MTTTVFLTLAGCRPASGLRPRLILQEEPVGDEFWLAAPFVLAVKITRADLQGSPEPIFQGGPRTLQLVKFTANVENVIKGDLSDKAVVFSFFVKLDQRRSYYLSLGKRYIISLRREGGVLRSFSDGSQLMIEVHSGVHLQKNLSAGFGPEAAITYILLTPGSDCDLRLFANTLRVAPLSYNNSAQYAHERLKQLQVHPDRFVRDSACLTDAETFWYSPKCLEEASGSPDDSTRLSANNFLNDDVNLLGRLHSNPFFMFPTHWTNHMTQMFEIYTGDMRFEVREAACALLRSSSVRL